MDSSVSALALPQHHDSSYTEQVDYARQLAELLYLLPSLVLKQKTMPSL